MLRRTSLAFASVVFSATVLGACNAVTGINNLEVITPPPFGDATGVSISEISIYQGVKRSLVGGPESPSGIVVPIVEGRQALLRVFTTLDASYDKSEVTARLTLGSDAPIEIVGKVYDSVEGDLGSTINFDIPGEKLTAGQTYRVELLQPTAHSKGDNANASHPASGSEALDIKSDGASLKLTIVPVQYATDGSNRLPDMSDAQIQGYKDAFFGTYPIRQLEVTIHDPWVWKKTINPNGLGWDSVLDGLANLRQQEHAPPDIYYFGIFEPADSFNQFCSFGCVAGLGLLGGPNDSYSRAAVGLGYTGNDAWITAIHEVGHNQGREHAPCGGADGPDPLFPYKDGSIGVWGYDMVSKRLIDPAIGKDMMGYCEPNWISDYTFKGIFDRMKAVNKARLLVPEAMKNLTWDRAKVGADGKLTWLDPVQLELPPQGEETTVTVEIDGQASAVTGQFFPYDHLPGGQLLWPRPAAPTKRVVVTLRGKLTSLTR